MYLRGVARHVVQRGNNRQATYFATGDQVFYLECATTAGAATAAEGGRAVQAAVSTGQAEPPDHEAVSEAVDEGLSRAARSSWARLLCKVYEVEPLTYPRCGGELRFLAVIEEAPVIERILLHVGVWEPTPRLRAPPEEAWPTGSQFPLTCHPVPDIARAD